MILKDGNFHWDLEEQKEEEKKAEQTILARKDQSKEFALMLTAFSKLKCNKITAFHRTATAYYETCVECTPSVL